MRPVCSGDMYGSVPSSTLGCRMAGVSRESSVEMPKSMTFSSPVSGFLTKFDVLMSLCITWRRWMCATIRVMPTKRSSSAPRLRSAGSASRSGSPPKSSSTIARLFWNFRSSIAPMTPGPARSRVMVNSRRSRARSSGGGYSWLSLLITTGSRSSSRTARQMIVLLLSKIVRLIVYPGSVLMRSSRWERGRMRRASRARRWRPAPRGDRARTLRGRRRELARGPTVAALARRCHGLRDDPPAVAVGSADDQRDDLRPVPRSGVIGTTFAFADRGRAGVSSRPMQELSPDDAALLDRFFHALGQTERLAERWHELGYIDPEDEEVIASEREDEDDLVVKYAVEVRFGPPDRAA